MNEPGDILAAAVGGRAVASVAVIGGAGRAPHADWTPASASEPAFLIYSITKTVIAALILGLCEDRRLALDDSLARWFPDIAGADRISLVHLLNHTSGLRDYGGTRAYHRAVRASPSIPWASERFAAETFDAGVCFAPGEGWAYSNPGYTLLRRIAEAVSGMSLSTLVKERIARPLGLKRTFVPESVGDLAALAPATSRALSPDGAPLDVRTHYHPGWVWHGVVASTASDVARVLDALLRGALLSPRSLARMTELVAVPVGPSGASPSQAQRGRPSYGLGLMGDPASRWGLVLGHDGEGPGYRASAFHARDAGGVTVCVMGATDEDFSAGAVVFDVLDAIMPRGGTSEACDGAPSTGQSSAKA